MKASPAVPVEPATMTQISLRLPRFVLEAYDLLAEADPDPSVDRSTLMRQALYNDVRRRHAPKTAQVERALDVLRAALLGAS